MPSAEHKQEELRPIEEVVQVKNTLNLSDLKNLHQQVRLPVKADNENQNNPKLVSQKFSFEELLTLWKEFSLTFKETGKMSEFLIMDREPEVINNQIILRLNNIIQSDQFQNFKADLLEFLRKNLKNYDLEIMVEVIEEPQTTKLYTNKEKLQYLISKNPAVDELRKRFGLETDF